MEGGPPMFTPGSTSPMLLKGSPFAAVQGYHLLQRAFPDASRGSGLIRFRSPLLTESLLLSFPVPTEMFQFSTFASCDYAFIAR